MPPVLRHEDRIARLEMRDASGLQCPAEFRKPLEVRRRGIDERQRRRERLVDRSDIQVGDLLRRKQQKPAAARHHAREVVVRILMSLSTHRASNPQPRQHLRRQERRGIATNEIRQMTRKRQRLDRDERRARLAERAQQVIERFGHPPATMRKIETAQIRRVEEPAPRFHRRLEHFDERARIHGFQVLVHRGRRASACSERRPVFQRTLDDDRLFCRDDRLKGGWRIDVLNRNPRERVEILRRYARFVAAHTVCK